MASQLPSQLLHPGTQGGLNGTKDLQYGDAANGQQFLQGLLNSIGIQGQAFSQAATSSPVSQPASMPLRSEQNALDIALGAGMSSGTGSQDPLSLIQATLATALQSAQPAVQPQTLSQGENTAASIAAFLAAMQDTAALAPSKPGRQSSQSGGELTPNIHAGIVTAREKNRQAQRRFRERQKSLITELREKCASLEKQLKDREQDANILREENNILKAKLEGKIALLQATQTVHRHPHL